MTFVICTIPILLYIIILIWTGFMDVTLLAVAAVAIFLHRADMLLRVRY
jgi:hypothetical protein